MSQRTWAMLHETWEETGLADQVSGRRQYIFWTGNSWKGGILMYPPLPHPLRQLYVSDQINTDDFNHMRLNLLFPIILCNYCTYIKSIFYSSNIAWGEESVNKMICTLKLYLTTFFEHIQYSNTVLSVRYCTVFKKCHCILCTWSLMQSTQILWTAVPCHTLLQIFLFLSPGTIQLQ